MNFLHVCVCRQIPKAVNRGIHRYSVIRLWCPDVQVFAGYVQIELSGSSAERQQDEQGRGDSEKGRRVNLPPRQRTDRVRTLTRA